MEDLKTSETWRVFRIQSELVEGFETLHDIGPAVSIFGSARMRPGQKYYDDAVTVAKGLGVDPELVWKTLVAHDEHNVPAVFCIPGPAELNLKKAARAVGAKKIELVNLKELTPLTGYVRGGCSPIGMKKSYATWVDETIALFSRIFVNAGSRGIQVIVAPEDLLRAANAKTADLI